MGISDASSHELASADRRRPGSGHIGTPVSPPRSLLRDYRASPECRALSPPAGSTSIDARPLSVTSAPSTLRSLTYFDQCRVLNLKTIPQTMPVCFPNDERFATIEGISSRRLPHHGGGF